MFTIYNLFLTKTSVGKIMMGKPQIDNKEALILLKRRSAPDIETLLALLEESGGRSIAVYHPLAMIVMVPSDTLSKIASAPVIRDVFIEPVGSRRLSQASLDEKPILEAWNQFLKDKKVPHGPGSNRGLSWDTPGLLPPDGPPRGGDKKR
ncbi:MAG: hypothetical protein KC592_08535 [Nitrospira sp.]|nr:hypothetical protein [Nitrospira sp.]